MSERAAGWIKLHRRMADADDRIWNSSEPFDSRSARIDLLFMAKFAPGPYATDYGVDVLERGELVGSVRFLARRWRWSKSRVERFIKRCIADGFLSGQGPGQHGEVYRIVKYEIYQGASDDSGPPSGTGLGQVWDKEREGKKERSNWLTPYLSSFNARYGTEYPASRLAGEIGPVRQKLGDEECQSRWGRFLAETADPTFATGAVFARTHTKYAGEASRAVATKNGGTGAPARRLTAAELHQC